jgi:CRISPR-associated protein Csm5
MSEREPVYNRRRFILRTLSPVHVGTGMSLRREIEIQKDQSCNRTLVFDMEAFFDCLPHEAAGLAAKVTNWIGLLNRYKVPVERVCLHILPGTDFRSAELRLAIRDGSGRPLVPGSSLKGALRTAILRTLVDRNRDTDTDPIAEHLRQLNQNPKFAAQKLERQLLRPKGGDPKQDLLRSVVVCDAIFARDKMGVRTVQLSSPRHDQPKRMTQYVMAVEALAPDSESEVEIALDNFLLQRPELGFRSFALTWSSLSAWMRAHTLRLLKEDTEHFSSLGWSGIVTQLKEVEHRIMSSHPESLPLRLGWGIGWCGTTGALVKAEQRPGLLDYYDGIRKRIGKHAGAAYSHGIAFPKSRRFSDPDGTANSPQTFGWILLEPAGGRRVPVPQPYSVEIPDTPAGGTPSVPQAPAAKEVRAVWKNCLLQWDPGSGGILTARSGNDRAHARQESAAKLLESLPPDFASRLKKKRQLANVAVQVRRLGNTWIIDSISAQD